MSRREAGPTLALALVRVASRLVPRHARDAWRREWEAELRTRWEQLSEASALTPSARLDLLLRASGSFADGVLYGRGRWSMGDLGQDVRMAARALARRPGFSAVVVLTLVVGIGATTAVFGVARDVLLRPFPYPDPDRVVAVEDIGLEGGGYGNVAYPNISDLAARSETFESLGAARWWVPALEHDAGSVVVAGATVTANFFDMLGMEAGEGRFFRPDEDGPGREPQVVISHALWMERFGGDRSLIGSEIRLSGENHRVIGVTPPEFEDPWIMDGPGREPQIWRTVSSPPSEWPRSGRSWKGIGRLRRDVQLAAAQEELSALFAALVESYPEHNAGYGVRVTPLRDRIAGPSEPVLHTLLGAVALLLLIACANLASLLLGRALERQGELVVHRAIGAPAWRILHRSLAEAGLLAAAGGVGGVVLALWLGGFARRLDAVLPRPVSGELDAGVVAFAIFVTALSAILFGLLPAVHSARSADALPSQDRGRGGSLGRRGQRLRRSLVVTELALTTALLVGSGLLVRSLQRLSAVDLGFRPDGVVSVELHGSAWYDLTPEAAQAQWNAVLEAVRAAPAVTAAGAIDYVPLGDGYSCDGFERDDQPPPEAGEGRCAEVRVVLPGALEALGVSPLRGRMLGERDGPDQPPVIVIDERTAATFWPGEDPIGARVRVHERTHEVVGIVADVRHFGPGGEVRPMVYLHAPQEGWNGITRGLALVARGSDAGALVVPIRDAVARVNASIALGSFQTVDMLLDRSLAAPRFRTLLMVAFGCIALFLAVLGIAGVMAYSVSRRTRELGLRLALGARPSEVREMVLREGGQLMVIGVALGLLGALAVAGVLERLLYDVGTRDPLVYLLVTALLAAAAMLACYVPARRASRVDPSTALASE